MAIKPSEKVTKAPYEGIEITDSIGRVIKLRKPTLLDTYDLAKAMGEEAKIPMCWGMAYNLLFVGLLDGNVFECPKTYMDVRAGLQRLDEHGLTAVTNALEKFSVSMTEKEAAQEVKK